MLMLHKQLCQYSAVFKLCNRPCQKVLEATPGFEPGVRALQALALPLGHVAIPFFITRAGQLWGDRLEQANGADNGVRTRDPHLGKVVLYQLSHVRLTGEYNTHFIASVQGLISNSVRLQRMATTSAR